MDLTDRTKGIPRSPRMDGSGMTDRTTADRYLASLAKAGIRPSLERISEALEAFGRPDRRYRIALITGTNGKGTCAKALAEILRGHGRRVGLYTSPHLFSYPERYEIGGKKIPEAMFRREIVTQRRLLESRGLRLTEFEFLTLLAYRLFEKHRVELAVVEVGMGGRWDATNAADPCLAVITGVGIDHVEFLGPDEKSIAFDKAHVARKNTDLLVGPVGPAARRVISNYAGKIGARAHFLNGASDVPASGNGWKFPLPSELFGTDFALAILAARKLLNGKFRTAAARKAIARAVLPGRFHGKIFRKRRILFDVAHNEQAFHALFSTILKRFGRKPPRRLFVLLGMQRQKRGEGKILPFLRPEDSVRLIRLKTPHSKSVRRWKPFVEAARRRRLSVDPPAPMRRVFTQSIRGATPHDLVVVTGSFHTVREALRLCD